MAFFFSSCLLLDIHMSMIGFPWCKLFFLTKGTHALPCAYSCLAFHSRLFFLTKAYSFLHHCLPTIALSSYSSILQPFRVALFPYQGTHSSMLGLLHARLQGSSFSLPMHHQLIHTWLSAVVLYLPLTKALTCLCTWPFMVALFFFPYQATCSSMLGLSW